MLYSLEKMQFCNKTISNQHYWIQLSLACFFSIKITFQKYFLLSIRCNFFLPEWLFSDRKESIAQQFARKDIRGRAVKRSNTARERHTARELQLGEKAGVVFTWLGIHLNQLLSAMLVHNLNQTLNLYTPKIKRSVLFTVSLISLQFSLGEFGVKSNSIPKSISSLFAITSLLDNMLIL